MFDTRPEIILAVVVSAAALISACALINIVITSLCKSIRILRIRMIRMYSLRKLEKSLRREERRIEALTSFKNTMGEYVVKADNYTVYHPRVRNGAKAPF